jgi:hypothetical protein
LLILHLIFGAQQKAGSMGHPGFSPDKLGAACQELFYIILYLIPTAQVVILALIL